MWLMKPLLIRSRPSLSHQALLPKPSVLISVALLVRSVLIDPSNLYGRNSPYSNYANLVPLCTGLSATLSWVCMCGTIMFDTVFCVI